jgi:hypothetical protein
MLADVVEKQIGDLSKKVQPLRWGALFRQGFQFGIHGREHAFGE